MGDETLSMRAFPSRNALTTKLFVEDVRKHYDGRPTFIVDSAPWLRGVLEEPSLRYGVGSFR